MADDTPDGYERIPIADWDALADALRRIAGGTVASSGDEIRLASGRATFTVTREGGVDAGMPLHEFATENVEALSVDTERGRIGVHGEGELTYEFRVP